jgi:uncharacterized protein
MRRHGEHHRSLDTRCGSHETHLAHHPYLGGQLMKKIATILGATALLALVATSAFAANQIRISQVYSGGGNAGATYKQKFVEIFNSGSTAVNVTGWALVYGSSLGSWNSTGGGTFTNSWVFPSATIQPCGYLLVSMLGTATTGADLTASVTPDFQVITPTPIINMSGSNGKIMLAQSVPANGVACGSEGVVIVDKVAYGPTSTCGEGTGTASLSTALAAVRNLGGLTDTDSNSADFSVVTPTTPRSSASAHNILGACAPVPTLRSTWGQVKSIYR